jgi:hypothetical protein
MLIRILGTRDTFHRKMALSWNVVQRSDVNRENYVNPNPWYQRHFHRKMAFSWNVVQCSAVYGHTSCNKQSTERPAAAVAVTVDYIIGGTSTNSKWEFIEVLACKVIEDSMPSFIRSYPEPETSSFIRSRERYITNKGINFKHIFNILMYHNY